MTPKRDASVMIAPSPRLRARCGRDALWAIAGLRI